MLFVDVDAEEGKPGRFLLGGLAVETWGLKVTLRVAFGMGRELFEPVRSSKGDVSDMMVGMYGSRGGESRIGSSEEKRDGCRQGGWRVSDAVHALGMRLREGYSVARMVQVTGSSIDRLRRRAAGVLGV